MIRGDLEEVLAQTCRDYVTVILTHKVDLDVIDMQDRLRLAFQDFWKYAGKRYGRQTIPDMRL